MKKRKVSKTTTVVKEVVKTVVDKTWDPNENPNVIAVVKQKDGNWKAIGQRGGKLVTTREQMPEHALVRLLTHV